MSGKTMFFNIKNSFLILLITFFASCTNKKVLNDRTAFAEISYYLETNPIFESSELKYGEVKFTKPKDQEELNNYLLIENFGYIEMLLEKEKKKFLSKDSVLTYTVQLKDKIIPFVIQKTDKTVKVQTFYYELDTESEVLIEQSGKNRAKATVTLLQKETDFAVLSSNSKAANSSFITKTFNMRFDEKTGWKVTK